MVGIAGVVVWLGYAVFAFGWSQVRGCNAGFLAMISPFGTQPVCAPDKSGGTLSPSGTGNVGQGTSNQYATQAEALAAAAAIGGGATVTHDPNGKWAVLAA
jgi:uncharacterized membrane protein